MSGTPSLSTHAQKPANFAEAMARLATIHAGELRAAFRNAAAVRQDAASWRRLEEVCAVMLQKRRAAVTAGRFARDPDWLLTAGRSERAFNELLSLSGQAELAESYVKAVEELIGNTAHWTFIFEAPVAAYWRHASLVWMSLWHAALAPEVTAAQAALCLGLKVKRKAVAEREKAEPGKFRPFASLGLSIWKKGVGAR